MIFLQVFLEAGGDVLYPIDMIKNGNFRLIGVLT